MKRRMYYDKSDIHLRKWLRDKRLSVLVLFSQLWIFGSVHADVWEYRRDGSVTTHRLPDYIQRAKMHEAWRPLAPRELAEKRAEFSRLIRAASLLYNVEARLIHAIIEVESAYDPNAVSKAGALGLMQLMPATAERFGVIDPLNAAENVEAGVRYLRILLDEFEDIRLVLAAYNAGEKVVRRYNNQIPPYKETRAYVKRVLDVIEAHEQAKEEADLLLQVRAGQD